MARKRATIADIARIAGVSSGAVSFALNDKPGVSDKARQRVIAIASDLGWEPSRAALALSGARVGVIERAPRALGTEAFFADLISGIQAGLAGTNVAMQLLVVADAAAELRAYRAWHASHQVDGVIILDPRGDDPRVAYVPGPAEHSHARLRASVFEALSSRGVESSHTKTDFSPGAATSATQRLLSASVRPSAMVYDNEVMALAGLRVAQTFKLAVPDAISIASFDGSVISEHAHPSITSLTRDTFEFGARRTSTARTAGCCHRVA